MSSLKSALRDWDRCRLADTNGAARLLVTADADGFHVWRIRGGEGIDPAHNAVVFRCDQLVGSASAPEEFPTLLRHALAGVTEQGTGGNAGRGPSRPARGKRAGSGRRRAGARRPAERRG